MLASKIVGMKYVVPMFPIRAENDVANIDDSLAYYKTLNGKKVPAELHIFPTGGHGYGLRKSGAPMDIQGVLSKEWLKRTVGH